MIQPQSAFEQAMGAIGKRIAGSKFVQSLNLPQKAEATGNVGMMHPAALALSSQPFLNARGWQTDKGGVRLMPKHQQGAGNVPINSDAFNVNDFRFNMGQKSYPNSEAQLRKMFKSVGNPPLSQYIPNLISAGEKHGVDPMVMAMVGQIESSGGKHYPVDTYNPFGYLGGTGNTVNERLNAGFTSVPHAINALTKRFSHRYPAFLEEPSISNLQQVYNANPAERQRYLDLSGSLLQNLQ